MQEAYVHNWKHYYRDDIDQEKHDQEGPYMVERKCSRIGEYNILSVVPETSH